MLYCTKCHGVCPDATAKCPNCKSAQLRQVNDDDLVLLHRADQYTASLLEQQFQERGIVYRMDPFSGGRISYPVSYTHLDVYKRQSLGMTSRISPPAVVISICSKEASRRWASSMGI